jgi:hypothetical protein
MTEHHNYIDFEFAKNVNVGKGRFIQVKRKRPKKKVSTFNRVRLNKPKGF